MKTSQVVMIVLIVIFAAALINWVRDGDAFHISHCVPLLGGYEPGIYDLGALVIAGIAIGGIRRFFRDRDK